jgi:hypothetical protein
MGVEATEMKYRDFCLSVSRKNGECPFVDSKDVQLSMNIL